jgi:hypothetical protein
VAFITSIVAWFWCGYDKPPRSWRGAARAPRARSPTFADYRVLRVETGLQHLREGALDAVAFGPLVHSIGSASSARLRVPPRVGDHGDGRVANAHHLSSPRALEYRVVSRFSLAAETGQSLIAGVEHAGSLRSMP